MRRFHQQHFYLIGDAEDHRHTVEARIKSIMAGCSGHLIILPKRADSFGHPDYSSLRSELAIGKGLDLPQFVLTESRLDFPTVDVTAFLDLQISDKPGESEIEPRLTSWAQQVRETCKPPADPQFIFVATDYDDLVMKEHVVRHMSQITGLPCLKGSDFGGQIPARKIELGIRKASMVIANVVSSTAPSGDPIVNLNTCVEAGIAMGAQRQVHMIGRRQPTDRWKLDSHLPFMIRHNTVETYGDDQDLIGLAHRFARPFRRRIINVEGVP